ncbi:MAG: nickel pincer cofactor biosynthesis protein LarC [Chloroflexi bacterium]|nr:nickel pincer cofactor biosynthesis protein LarC [Chloroflexota bacterium]
MKIGYFDCIGGASGDMLLGALIDAGASQDAVLKAISSLNLKNWKVDFKRTQRGGISAIKATVTAEKRQTARPANEMLKLIENASLNRSLKKQVSTILGRLIEVEAQIHGVSAKDVHLHELGGDDTLIDIVGVIAGVENLGLDTIRVSPLPMARGWIKSAHGPLPLPAPATLALLKGVPIQAMELEAELVTPTGAVLLTSLASEYGSYPKMTLSQIGYGAGQRQFPFPNVVRLLIGETTAETDGLLTEWITILETNIDDLNPQVYDHLIKQLFELNALDVTITPLSMKKNRPGIALSVLCKSSQSDVLIDCIFTETTTLGIRRHEIERVSLPRHVVSVNTPFGQVHVKMTHWKGKNRASPEYEDCRRIAAENNVPLIDVMHAARESALIEIEEHPLR